MNAAEKYVENLLTDWTARAVVCTLNGSTFYYNVGHLL